MSCAEPWITATEGADTWSPYRVMGHLIHGELTDWIPRLEIILQHGPSLTFATLDRFAHFSASEGKSLAGLLDEFARLRGQNLARLDALHLDARQLLLTATHPEFGFVSTRQLIATWTAHDLGHYGASDSRDGQALQAGGRSVGSLSVSDAIIYEMTHHRATVRLCALAAFAVAMLVPGWPTLSGNLLASDPRPHAVGRRHFVVIDTDVGPDDLMAIAFLLGRQDVTIGAIVVETGLTRVDAGARNVLRLLHLAGADSVPVYIGAAEHLQPTVPFPESWIDATERLGALAAPPGLRPPEQGSATDVLVRVLTNPEWRESHTELLALGPLTNIALAIRKAGRDRVQPIRTVIMGGAIDAPGNLVTPDTKSDNTKAEWNVFSDPQAAREVFESPLRIELIALDATGHVKMDSCFVQAMKSGPATPLRGYVGRIMDSARQWVDRGDYYAWDPLAAVAVVDSGVVRSVTTTLVVETDPPFPGWTHRAPNGRDVAVAINADRQRFMRVFDAGLGPRHGAPITGCH